MENYTAGHSGKRLVRLLALGATFWSIAMSLGTRDTPRTRPTEPRGILDPAP